MTAPTPYLHLPGTARAALPSYAEVVGCGFAVHSFADLGREDGPADAVGHGYLVDGPVALFAADVAGDEPVFTSAGLVWALLGAADPATLRAWFTDLAAGGRVVDRFGVHWLIGFEGDG
ncbi:VOC family protein [Modestobacter muralis]|uniref:VOC family protein n=1 Tax=Modestobacter muralis TaxID=1608614 RepID=A0A6P0HD27_9ACTN|nr:VOC family protein [Modestobacter muralis]NEK95978.1 VOC family protein [Modestobacter muralis]NEN52866.1 VOC family protein [Modestobacter muralis]